MRECSVRRSSSSRRGAAVQTLPAFLVLCAICLAQNQTDREARSNYIHGTIVVVVSTKDGFVLAGDSQGSSGCNPVPGEFEKVFALGKRSGLVLAGIIVSTDADGQLRVTIAKRLHDVDERSK